MEFVLAEAFAVLREVEPREFFLRRHAQSDREIDDFENQRTHEPAVKECGDDACGLNGELRHHVRKGAFRDGARCKHPGKKCSHNAAHAVHAEGIQGIVIPERAL